MALRLQLWELPVQSSRFCLCDLGPSNLSVPQFRTNWMVAGERSSWGETNVKNLLSTMKSREKTEDASPKPSLSLWINTLLQALLKPTTTALCQTPHSRETFGFLVSWGVRAKIGEPTAWDFSVMEWVTCCFRNREKCQGCQWTPCRCLHKLCSSDHPAKVRGHY